jgi:hypothetical protein
VRRGRVRLLSRNGYDITPRFPAVADALAQLPDGTVLDFELVVLDGAGYPDFAALMRSQGAGECEPIAVGLRGTLLQLVDSARQRMARAGLRFRHSRPNCQRPMWIVSGRPRDDVSQTSGCGAHDYQRSSTTRGGERSWPGLAGSMLLVARET